MNSEKQTVFKFNDSVVILLIFLHLLIALPLAYFLSIWADEASTLYTTEHGFLHAWQNALADEKQAPLYFWIMSLWRTLNDSIIFARLFSIICSVLAIKFFGDLAKKVFSEKTAILAVCFFALHPYLFWASLEIRVYSLVILLSVLLLKFFYEGYFETDGKARKSSQVLYVATAIVALYTNYYLGFLLVGNFSALLILRKWREAKNYFLQMIFVGITFLPLIYAIKQQFSANTEGSEGGNSIIEGIRVLWDTFLTFALPTEIFTPENISSVSFIRLWLMRLAVLVIVILLFKNLRKLDKKLISFAVICAVICIFLLTAYFLLGLNYIVIRHMAVLFAPLVVLIWLVLENILLQSADSEKVENKSNIQKLILISLIVLFAASFSYSIYTLYPNLTKRGDWMRVGKYIEQNEQPNQPIIIFTAFESLALPYNYKGVNQIFPDEQFFDWESEAKIGSNESRNLETEFIISEIPQNAQEIWLLTNSNCKTGQTCQPLENFVQAHYTVVKEKDFYEEKVRLLRKK